jgi:hypothetical protein
MKRNRAHTSQKLFFRSFTIMLVAFLTMGISTVREGGFDGGLFWVSIILAAISIRYYIKFFKQRNYA